LTSMVSRAVEAQHDVLHNHNPRGKLCAISK
jgi:hypothetical protein